MNQSHHRLNLPTALTVAICGGGNGAHAAAAYISAKPGIAVNVFTRKPESWSEQLTLSTEQSSWSAKGTIVGTLNKISADPSVVIPEADVVIIAAPSHVHKTLCDAVSSHLKPGAILGALYAQGGFDWVVKSSINDMARIDGIFGLQNIPWLCRAVEYGKRARIIGPKKFLVLAAYPAEKATSYSKIVSLLFDIPTRTIPNFLSLTLSPSNQIIHPARYYAIFSKWDGKTAIPQDTIPKGLYTEMDQASADYLALLDQELQLIKSGLQRRFPTLDLSSVYPIKDRIISQYGSDVEDPSTLLSVFRTNRGYAGVQTPVQQEKEGFVLPATQSRLFWEDIPYGLCILKSIAQLLDLETPTVDLMILWHQQYMGVVFMDPTTKRLKVEALAKTGTPEAYGLRTLDDLVSFSLG